MIKLSDGKKKIELDLPIKIEYENKEYWIKESTKIKGIYMNTQPVFFNLVVEESDSVTISKNIINKSKETK